MKILICNDDGYQASGIVALYEALKDVAEVEVVAPEHNNSVFVDSGGHGVDLSDSGFKCGSFVS